ncbi:MAG: hypothetical protein ACRDD7_04805 [Peptostreptococcaceae bacterium]
MLKKFFSICLICVLLIPTTALAYQNNDTECENNTELMEERTPSCPAYPDENHNFKEKIWIRNESTTQMHYELLPSGNYVPCTITKDWAVFRVQCACGYYTPNSTIRELRGERHNIG